MCKGGEKIKILSPPELIEYIHVHLNFPRLTLTVHIFMHLSFTLILYKVYFINNLLVIMTECFIQHLAQGEVCEGTY